jgi:cytochrome P450
MNTSAWFGVTWRHALWQLSDPLRFVTYMAEHYGDIVFYRLFIHRAYQINHPDLVRSVLVTKADCFKKQVRQRNLIRRIAGEGILTTDGPEWVRKRRMVLPAFQTNIGRQMAEIAVDEVRKLTASWTGGGQVDLYRSMTDLMIRTVGRSFFGVSTEADAQQLATALHTLGECLLDRDYFLVRLAGWFPSLKVDRRRQAEATLQAYFDQAISARRRQPGSYSDLLGLLLAAVDREGDGRGLTEEDVRAEARTMFYAGHHTAAACLTWTLYLLAKHPSIRARLLAEIDDVLGGQPPTTDDIPRLTYTTQVIQESMRLYPPAWALFAREAIQEVEIGGYLLPRGAWVFIYPWVLHRDQRFFPDPLKFDPERFAADKADQLPVGAYIPFGLGAHNCVGGRIAMMAIQLALPAILQQFTLDLPADQPSPELHTSISLRPKCEIRMIANSRPRAGLLASQRRNSLSVLSDEPV